MEIMTKYFENAKWIKITYIGLLTSIFLFYEIYTLELYLPILPLTQLLIIGGAYLTYVIIDCILMRKKHISPKSNILNIYFKICKYGIIAPTLFVNLFYNFGGEFASILFNPGLLIFLGIEIWVLRVFRRYISEQPLVGKRNTFKSQYMKPIMLLLILVISSVPGLLWEIKYLNDKSHVIYNEYITASTNETLAFIPIVQNFPLNPNFTRGYESMNDFTQFRYAEENHLLNRPGPNMYPRRIYEQYHIVNHFSDGIKMIDEDYEGYSILSYEHNGVPLEFSLPFIEDYHNAYLYSNESIFVKFTNTSHESYNNISSGILFNQSVYVCESLARVDRFLLFDMPGSYGRLILFTAIFSEAHEILFYLYVNY